MTFPKASTREAYGKALLELGREDPQIVVLGGDLNLSTFTYLFGREFPHRFFDFGAAEQNIMGVAAGLAAAGKTPFVSTFAAFGTSRPYDQIRVSIAQPRLNVKIVVTHGGIITGEDGISAHSIEDLALMGALPGFHVVVPADAVETVAAVKAAARVNGPFYIRLCRPATPVVHQDSCPFTLDKAEVLRQGWEVTIVAMGIMVAAALEAAEALAQEGIDCRVLNFHTLRPPDTEAIEQAARDTGALVTAEEHYIYGGLGSLVSQIVAQRCPVPVEQVALRGYAESGNPEALLEKYGLTSRDVAAAVKRVLARKYAS